MTLAEAYARLNIVQKFLPVGSSNRPGTAIVPTYITIHNTANSGRGADALMHAQYLKSAEARQRQVSWHYTVDDHRVVQNLLSTEIGWHAGSREGNRQSVGVEICENEGIDTGAAVDRASLLSAILMHSLNVSPMRIVPHQFWTGKHCPHIILDSYPGGMKRFGEMATGYLTNLEAAQAPADAPAADRQWRQLVGAYAHAPIAYPQLKAVTLAQWILASDRGTTGLAATYMNYCALLWRPEMAVYASAVRYESADGAADYCAFASPEAFILGYWHFVDRAPYRGWEAHTDSAEAFIRFLADAGFDSSPEYAANVLARVDEANQMLSQTQDQAGS